MGVAAFFVALAAGVYTALHIYDPVIRPILDVLPPFLAAFAFAFLLDPVVDWMQRMGASRGFGVAIVGIAFLIMFVVVGFAVVPRVAEQAGALAHNLPTYTDRAQGIADGTMARAKPLLERLRLPTTTAELNARFSRQFEEAASSSLSVLAGYLSAAVSRILWLVFIPLTTLWLLKDLDYLKAKVVYLTPDRYRQRLVRVSSEVGAVFGRYVRGMLAVAMIFSAVTSAVLSIVGLDYALVIGGLSGLFYLVPYLGVVTLGGLAAIAALVEPGMGGGYAAALFVYMLVQSFVVFDLGITPRIVGGSVGVHPVLMLFSLALGARLFGVAGLVAAVPVAAACQVALGQFCPRIHDRVKPVMMDDSVEQDSDPVQREPSST